MELKKILIVVVGPTASGKSELAVRLAKKYDGEIISADSRQIYSGLNIGSGKVEGKWVKVGNKKLFLYKKIPHYLIDEASPKVQYSAARYQKSARKIILDIFKRGKTPIVCGGTAHWIDAVVLGQTLPEVKPNAKLRTTLSKMTTEKLFQKLQKLDPVRAAEIDPKNPRRLIRALEIVMSTGKPVPKMDFTVSPFIGVKVKWVGINPPMLTLEKRIKTRLQERLQAGMVREVARLRKNGLSWRKLEAFGLEYKYCALFLQKRISRTELQTLLYTAIRQYAKRQLTWWKRNQEIEWFSASSSVKLAK